MTDVWGSEGRKTRITFPILPKIRKKLVFGLINDGKIFV